MNGTKKTLVEATVSWIDALCQSMCNSTVGVEEKVMGSRYECGRGGEAVCLNYPYKPVK